MKTLIEKLIRMRNASFRFDPQLNSYLLFLFTIEQARSILRGIRVTFGLRNPKMMLRGRKTRLFNLPQIRWGKFLKLGDQVLISAMGKGNVLLGDHISIGSFSRVVISTSLDNLGDSITLGNNVGIGEFAYLGGGGVLEIGDDCIIGQYFSCHPENHIFSDTDALIRKQGVSRKGITIGKNCWIGSKVTILDGVTIGEGCVIAAGSVVSRSFGPNSVIGGVPASRIRKRVEPQQTIGLDELIPTLKSTNRQLVYA